MGGVVKHCIRLVGWRDCLRRCCQPVDPVCRRKKVSTAMNTKESFKTVRKTERPFGRVRLNCRRCRVNEPAHFFRVDLSARELALMIIVSPSEEWRSLAD